MKKFYSNIKLISWFLLCLTAFSVIFYSSWFFLGNEETHNKLKQEFIKNLVYRTVGFTILGLPTIFLITLIEYYGIKNVDKKYRILLKKLNLIISVILLASFLGSAMFFFS